MEGEQEKGGKIEGVMKTEESSPQATRTETDNAMTISVAEEARNAASVDDNKTCSNGGS